MCDHYQLKNLAQQFAETPTKYPLSALSLLDVLPDVQHMISNAWSFYCFFKALAILLFARLYSMARFLATYDCVKAIAPPNGPKNL